MYFTQYPLHYCCSGQNEHTQDSSTTYVRMYVAVDVCIAHRMVEGHVCSGWQLFSGSLLYGTLEYHVDWTLLLVDIVEAHYYIVVELEKDQLLTKTT